MGLVLDQIDVLAWTAEGEGHVAVRIVVLGSAFETERHVCGPTNVFCTGQMISDDYSLLGDLESDGYCSDTPVLSWWQRYCCFYA